jgi:hypothetical protein
MQANPSTGLSADRSPVDRHDPLDVEAWRKLSSLLGEVKVGQLMSMLAVKLETTVSETAIASADRAELARIAHAAVSSAGVLGFATFAKLCTDLEAACATEADLSDLKSRVLTERRLILARMAELTGRPRAPTVATAPGSGLV